MSLLPHADRVPNEVPGGSGRPIRGVVLIGGHSSRMGRPKSEIEYRPGVSATRRAVDLLSKVCDGVYLSLRPGQEVPGDVTDIPRVTDRYVGVGPIGGILSALETDPNAAWFTLGCDMPLLRDADVTVLAARRDEGAIATSAIAAPARSAASAGYDERGVSAAEPEPLCTIWEPRARNPLHAALSRGERSPRRVLLVGPTNLVELSDPTVLFNVNTPTDRNSIAVATIPN